MGRRVEAGEEQRKAVNTRIRSALRTRLEEAAVAANRTLSHEVEERLERSFDSYDHALETFKSTESLAVATAIANAWHVIELMSGKKWTANQENIALARKAADAIMMFVIPKSGEASLYEGETAGKTDEDMVSGMAAYVAFCWVRGQKPDTEAQDSLVQASARLFDRTTKTSGNA